MMRKSLIFYMYYSFFNILIVNRKCHGLIDPFSLALGGGVLGGIYFKDFLKANTYCRYYECCNDEYIRDPEGWLHSILRTTVFGQHIANDVVEKSVVAHTRNNAPSKKPLVLSLHGTPGTGKNFVSDIIVETIYKEGSKSNFVVKFLGRSDFPLASRVYEYMALIQSKVLETIKLCPRSIFIFDEVDKMPPGLFESVSSLLDHHSSFRDYSLSKAIFIFLSNTGGVEISEKLTELTANGKWREDTKLYDFEKILEVGSYNIDGGLKQTSLIELHLVDHFIPFLPLERKHVRKCIEKEFEKWGKTPSEADVTEIIDKFLTFDKKTGMYATSGCKTLEKKVAVYVNKR